jgi:DNA replication protein DnaC
MTERAIDNDFIKMLAQRSAKLPINDTDYIKDGILYCGKCNTPKQANIPLDNGSFFRPRCLCKCETEQRDKKNTEFKLRLKREKSERVFRTYITLGLQDQDAMTDSFDKDKKPTDKKSLLFRRYCEKWQQVKDKNTGLIIFGDVGTGKTFYANCIANEIRNKYGELCLTITTKMLTGISTFDKMDIIRRIIAVDLLVIDDLGAERDSEYAQEIICDLMDERDKTDRPTIITTNLSYQDLKLPQSIQQQRIYDRVLKMCSPVEMSGKSEREKIAAQKKDELKNIIFKEE